MLISEKKWKVEYSLWYLAWLRQLLLTVPEKAKSVILFGKLSLCFKIQGLSLIYEKYSSKNNLRFLVKPSTENSDFRVNISFFKMNQSRRQMFTNLLFCKRILGFLFYSICYLWNFKLLFIVLEKASEKSNKSKPGENQTIFCRQSSIFKKIQVT